MSTVLKIYILVGCLFLVSCKTNWVYRRKSKQRSIRIFKNTNMKFFIDTANLAEIAEAQEHKFYRLLFVIRCMLSIVQN